MRFGAAWVERLFADGEAFETARVVAEFDKYLHDELDLMREAANASQLGRNFQNSNMLIVPKVFYDYCTSDVLTIEWMDGTPVSEIAKLKADGIDCTNSPITAWKSSSRKFSATAFSMRICTPAIFWSPPTTATSPSISASSAR